MTYIFDACALLSMINGEAGGDIVERVFEEASAGSCDLSMSIVQLLEIYYDQVYLFGEAEARKIIETLIAGPIYILDTISYPVMYEAGRIKTVYHCSLADAIACATAISFNATLVTSDHKEIEPVKTGENLSILWLPPHPKR
jgi:predicted nucleic acid-binding protein